MPTMFSSLRRAGALIAASVFVFSLGSWAQTKMAVDYNASAAPAHDLSTTLTDLTRVVPVTEQDLGGLHKDSKIRWVEFWNRNRAHRAPVIASLRRNLQMAMPGLIKGAQESGGSISTTFKLYQDLNAVCESIDSLLPHDPSRNKIELAVASDLSEMNRIKEDLSSYIQQTAASFESRHPELVASRFPKKIIVDDKVPDKPARKKHHPSNH